jgi:hypothetical protein
MSANTGICQCGISTPQVAVNSSQLLNTTQNLMQWAYVSTVQAARPGYVYQYKSQTERIQALMGGLNQCPS